MRHTKANTPDHTVVPTDGSVRLWVWRHPRPEGVTGRCIGQTDVAVDPRRSKRLARRIQAQAQRSRRSSGCPPLAPVVYTSTLVRSADVGRWLKRWGWVHVQDAQLLEITFGRWDGRAWSDVDKVEIDAWCADFAHHLPGGGESIATLIARSAAWAPPGLPDRPVAVVGHAGWMLARHWAQTHPPDCLPERAADWPAPPGTPAYGACWTF